MNKHTGTIAILSGDKRFRVRKTRGFDPVNSNLSDIPYSVKLFERAELVVDVDSGKILKQRKNVDPHFLLEMRTFPIWEVSDLSVNGIFES